MTASGGIGGLMMTAMALLACVAALARRCQLADEILQRRSDTHAARLRIERIRLLRQHIAMRVPQLRMSLLIASRAAERARACPRRTGGTPVAPRRHHQLLGEVGCRA